MKVHSEHLSVDVPLDRKSNNGLTWRKCGSAKFASLHLTQGIPLLGALYSSTHNCPPQIVVHNAPAGLRICILISTPAVLGN